MGWGGGPSFPDTDRRPASLRPVKRNQSGERLHGDSLGIVFFGAASTPDTFLRFHKAHPPRTHTHTHTHLTMFEWLFKGGLLCPVDMGYATMNA